MTDVNIETTKVGDRYVLERMRKRATNLGGEQSGHITFLDYLPTVMPSSAQYSCWASWPRPASSSRNWPP